MQADYWKKTMIRVSHLEFVKLMALVPKEKRQIVGTLNTWSIKDELFTHPLHHFVRLYRKLEFEKELEAMLKRVLQLLEQRGFSRFTVGARKKIQGYLEALTDKP